MYTEESLAGCQCAEASSSYSLCSCSSQGLESITPPLGLESGAGAQSSRSPRMARELCLPPHLGSEQEAEGGPTWQPGQDFLASVQGAQVSSLCGGICAMQPDQIFVCLKIKTSGLRARLPATPCELSQQGTAENIHSERARCRPMFVRLCDLWASLCTSPPIRFSPCWR